MGLIAAGIEAHANDRPGGILVRLADQISKEDRILLQTVARAIITDSDGSLAEQLSRVHLRLGEGAPRGLSRDGKWVLAAIPSTPARIMCEAYECFKM